MIGAQDVFGRIWAHMILKGSLPSRLFDGRLVPGFDAGDGNFPASGMPTELFLGPGRDYTFLVGAASQQWVMAARQSTPMDLTGGELLAEAEVAARECARACIVDGILLGDLFTPMLRERLEAIRKDFRLAEYSPPVPKRT